MTQASNEPRTFGASDGIDWLRSGCRVFMTAPGLWLVMAIVLFFVFIALALIPFIGTLIAQVIGPALMGGALLAARDSGAGRAPDLGRLFEPLVDERNRGNILILGLLQLGGYIFALVLGLVISLLLIGGTAIQTGTLWQPGDVSASAAAAMGAGVILALLIWVALGAVVAAVFFYAVPLVALGNAMPIDAIVNGVRGLLRNWRPLLVLGLIWTVLAILATLPLMLGWLVLGPVTWGAWYASYTDIFEPPPADTADAAASEGLAQIDAD